MEPIINIYNSRTIEGVTECLSKFNQGHEKVLLKAYGANVSKGIEIAQLLRNGANVTIQRSNIDSFKTNDSRLPTIEIPLKIGKSKLIQEGKTHCENIREDFGAMNFINYSTYHLIFDWYLANHNNLSILIRDKDNNPIPLLNIEEKNGRRSYKISPEVMALTRQEYDKRNKDKNKSDKKKNGYLSKINDALSRSGLLMPKKWKEIAKKLSEYDDVILGLDTNMLYHCSVTKHLLPAISLVEHKDYVHTPNWILLIVPSTVMFELEDAANHRNEYGQLDDYGRKAYRAIQEILEISENIDIPGISLLITGETNPILDTKGALNHIQQQLFRLTNAIKDEGRSGLREKKKSSSGDMTIRYQYKQFLNQMDFHKGTYFLTADKSNSVLAMAEGLRTMYISYAHLSDKRNDSPKPETLVEDVETNPGELVMDVPLGNIIYEMAISFKEIIVACGNNASSIFSDTKGESPEHWVHKQLRMNRDTLDDLLANYKGKLDLEETFNLFKNITQRFECIEWLSEMGGAF